MTDKTVLFRVDVDESGALQGFRLSRDELEKLRRSTDEAGDAAARSARDTDKLGRSQKKTAKSSKELNAASLKLKAAIAGIFTIATVRQAIIYADTVKNLESRIRVATDSTAEFKKANDELFEISKRTFSSLESTVELYARLELSLKSSEVAQEDVLKVTESLNKAYQSAGATAAEAASSVIQLSQGLAAGALRGDEYRSVMEQAPRVVQALADSLQITRGELKALADEGQLSTELIVQALLEQGEAIDRDFQNIELTVGRAFTNMKTEALAYVGEIDKATGATTTFAEAINTLGENLDTVANVAIVAMEIGLLALVPAFARAATGARLFIASLGPLGIMATILGTATFALLEYLDATDEAAESTRNFARSLKDLETVKGLEGMISRTQEGLGELKAEADALKEEFFDLEDKEQGVLPIVGIFRMTRDEVEARKTEIIAELAELDAVIESRNETIEKARETVEELTKSEKDAKKTAKELLEQRAAEAAQLDALTEATKEYTSALTEFGTQSERIQILEDNFAATMATIEQGFKDQPGAIAKITRARELLRAATDKNIKAIRDELDEMGEFKEALRELRRETVDTTEEGFLQLELQLETLAEKFNLDAAAVEALMEQIRAARLELELLNEEGETYTNASVFAGGYNSVPEVLGAGMRTAIEEGFEAGADVINSAFKSNPGEAIAFGAAAANTFFALNREYNRKDEFGLDPYGGSADGTIRALADTILPIVAMMGPWGAAIAGVISLVDGITGGGLFGTAFETTEGRRSFNVSDAGGTGGAEFDQKRKKSFFRGTSRRTVEQDLSADGQKAVSALYDAAYGALFGAIEGLGVAGAEFVEGAFLETFDADGNLVSSVSTVLGKAYEETFEEFSSRLIAENMISAVAAAVGDVEVTQLVERRQPGPGFTVGDDRGSIRPGGTGVFDEVTSMVNEAQAIAERWRGSAEVLLEGAQLLLVAQAAIQDGSGLFDSLTATVDIVEELAGVGETLIETYARLIQSLKIVEDAFALLDENFIGTRDEIVRFSEAFTDAAGGVDRASQLWGSYFQTFFDADELLEAQLRVSRGVLEEEFADIGLSPNTGRDEFKRIFEEILPTLSADSLVQWLEAGEALGVVLSLEEELGDIRLTNAESVRDAYRETSDAIDDILGGTITSLRRELMSDDQLYGEFRSSALDQAGLISSAGSRSEVLDLVAQIDELTGNARGVAGDTRFNAELIEFLEQVGAAAGIRLGELEAEEVAEIELRAAEVASREAFSSSTETFASSVETFAGAVTAGGGIVIEGGDAVPLNQQIVDGIREGFDPETMGALMTDLRKTVEVFAQVTQFHAENPPTINVSQPPPGDDLGLS